MSILRLKIYLKYIKQFFNLIILNMQIKYINFKANKIQFVYLVLI